MLVGITGDTHGSFEAMEKVIKKAPVVDLWLHTGDYYQDIIMLYRLSKTKVIGVCGNNDFGYSEDFYNKIFTIKDKLILLTHGHRDLLKGKDFLIERAQKLKIDILIYGHTHQQEFVQHDDFYIINPGSPVYPRNKSKAGFALLEIKFNKNVDVKFIDL